jgi:Tocopherol cyclase
VRGRPALDGWFWRFTWPDGRAAIVLCGVCPGWALAGVGAHPGRAWRSAILDAPEADARGVRIGRAFAGEPGRVRLDLGDGARVDAELRDPVRWPRPWPGTGPGGWLPGLRQYWRPLVLRARAEGVIDAGERWTLEGATAYVERNWGNGFPPVWWWGEAHDFDGDPVTVAFAGGPALGPLQATAVVVHVGGRLVRLGEPVLAAVAADTAPGRWVLRGRSPRHRVEIEAAGDPAAAHVLDVPVPAERRTLPWSHQHLAGRLRVRATRRGRLLYEGESALAGLEFGRALATPRRFAR